MRLKNILSTFDCFAGNELLPERTFQDYQSIYIDLYQQYRPKTDENKENINDDIEFEVELIRQVEINIDYILVLVEQYHASNCQDKNILGAIDRAISSSIQLRSKKELIESFIETVNASTEVERDWHIFVEQQKETDLERIIAEEKLKPEERHCECLSIEVLRLNNEIDRQMTNPRANADQLLQLIMDCAKAKYEVSESGASEQMTQLIQERLADQPLISDFDYDLFSSITEKILIQPNASVHLQLRNGKMI